MSERQDSNLRYSWFQTRRADLLPHAQMCAGWRALTPLPTCPDHSMWPDLLTSVQSTVSATERLPGSLVYTYPALDRDPALFHLRC